MKVELREQRLLPILTSPGCQDGDWGQDGDGGQDRHDGDQDNNGGHI